MKYANSIASISLGNILEWYDFGLFTIFSSVFAHSFFPSHVQDLALMGTLVIFSVGFICRPIGAILFGYLGDRYGRAKTLRFSILFISIPTLLIAFLPTYNQVGMLAPILFMVTRMCQGISIGGEYSGSLIYLTESAPQNHRAFVTTFASIGSNIGILLATFLGFICSEFFQETQLHSFGWRIPYLLGGFLSLFVYFYRLKIKETQGFIRLKANNEVLKNPLRALLCQDFSPLLQTLGLVCMGTTFYYYCFAFIPIFLSHNMHATIHTITLLMAALFGLIIIVTPIGGLICDKVGRRNLFLFNVVFIITILIPGSYLLQTYGWNAFVFVLPLFAVASALEQSTTPVTIIENFPLRTRFTGISLGYNIGNGLLGGTVPLVCEWLLAFTHYSLAPACYITFCALVTGLVAFCFLGHSRPSIY